MEESPDRAQQPTSTSREAPTAHSIQEIEPFRRPSSATDYASRSTCGRDLANSSEASGSSTQPLVRPRCELDHLGLRLARGGSPCFTPGYMLPLLCSSVLRTYNHIQDHSAPRTTPKLRRLLAKHRPNNSCRSGRGYQSGTGGLVASSTTNRNTCCLADA